MSLPSECNAARRDALRELWPQSIHIDEIVAALAEIGTDPAWNKNKVQKQAAILKLRRNRVASAHMTKAAMTTTPGYDQADADHDFSAGMSAHGVRFEDIPISTLRTEAARDTMTEAAIMRGAAIAAGLVAAR